MRRGILAVLVLAGIGGGVALLRLRTRPITITWIQTGPVTSFQLCANAACVPLQVTRDGERYTAVVPPSYYGKTVTVAACNDIPNDDAPPNCTPSQDIAIPEAPNAKRPAPD